MERGPKNELRVLLKVLFTGTFSMCELYFSVFSVSRPLRPRLHAAFGSEARTNKVLKVKNNVGKFLLSPQESGKIYHSLPRLLFQIISGLKGIVGDFQPAEPSLR